MMYTTIYVIPSEGLFADKAMITVRIGPIQGVQPAANPIPINTDPRYPTGLFEN